MSKRFLQFIASIFLLIGGGMFYDVFSAVGQKAGGAWIFEMLAGLIVFIGVLIFIWVAHRKRKPN